LVQQGEGTMEARKDILIEQRVKLRSRMEEFQKSLDLLNYKIDFYENALLKAENDLVELEV
jgi:MerR family transcriptional regulator, aldehyde-responsive regulator